MFTFSMWARRQVGGNPPVLSAAISLVPRRLGDYIWWPSEILLAGVVACSWWMVLRHYGPGTWQDPLTITWVVLGLLPGKITVVRQGWPLPAERAEEHRAAQEAARRYSVRMMDAFAWLVASILLMTQVRQAWPAARTEPAIEWLVVGVPVAFSVVLMVVVARQNRIIEMSRGLRPAGSWAPPSGRALCMSRSGITWFTVWFGGLIVLMLLARH